MLRRLAAGETVTLPYGKLMERLLYFHQLGSMAYLDQLMPVAEVLMQRAVTLHPHTACTGAAAVYLRAAGGAGGRAW